MDLTPPPLLLWLRLQAWVGGISHSVRGVALDGRYRSAETFQYQDALGDSILRLMRVVPDGMLCFLPSYTLLDKVRAACVPRVSHVCVVCVSRVWHVVATCVRRLPRVCHVCATCALPACHGLLASDFCVEARRNGHCPHHVLCS